MENIRVLLVDDDPELGRMMTMKLRIEAPHFSIRNVESGVECLEFVKKGEVDCVLSDYQMPEMDGMELLAAVREVDTGLPFIFITGQGNEGLARDAFKGSADDYFTKDVGFAHFTRIINSVEQAVRRRNSEAERMKAEEEVRKNRARLEARLAEVEARYQSTVSAVAEGIIIVDRTGAIADCNRSAERLFGLRRDEIVGMNIFDSRWDLRLGSGARFTPDDRFVRAAFDDGMTLERLYVKFNKPSGVRASALVNAVPFYGEGGRPTAVVVSMLEQ
ncbi:MAG: response regulator [Nitrospirae bacterium]|nr:response regulator [Nitrospirota bacterium]MBI5695616.1 response regulator [Nitrospirota bacterium]